MFCPNCGKKIADDSVFCDNCGEKVIDGTVKASVTQAVPKAPKPTKAPTAPKPKRERIKFDKAKIITAALYLVLAILYVGISLLPILALTMPKTLTAVSVFDSDITADFSLKEFISLLINGNAIFHPTAISSAAAIGYYIFVYSVPLFCVLALVSAIINKRTIFFNLTATVFACVSAAISVLIVPLTLKFVPKLIQVLSLNIGMIVSDIAKVTLFPVIICAAAVIVLVIGTIILTAILNKRRAK